MGNIFYEIMGELNKKYERKKTNKRKERQGEDREQRERTMYSLIQERNRVGREP